MGGHGLWCHGHSLRFCQWLRAWPVYAPESGSLPQSSAGCPRFPLQPVCPESRTREDPRCDNLFYQTQLVNFSLRKKKSMVTYLKTLIYIQDASCAGFESVGRQSWTSLQVFSFCLRPPGSVCQAHSPWEQPSRGWRGGGRKARVGGDAWVGPSLDHSGSWSVGSYPPNGVWERLFECGSWERDASFLLPLYFTC